MNSLPPDFFCIVGLTFFEGLFSFDLIDLFSFLVFEFVVPEAVLDGYKISRGAISSSFGWWYEK